MSLKDAFIIAIQLMNLVLNHIPIQKGTKKDYRSNRNGKR